MLIDDVALTMTADIGPKTAKHLVSCFGSAEGVFAATERQLTVEAELRGDLARAIVRKDAHKAAERELAWAGRSGVTVVTSTGEYYPPLLSECADAPHVLYVRGDPEVLLRPTLSIGGTRKISAYGTKACDTIIEGLHEAMPGATIAAGLSYGIDIACHRAAHRCGMPSGVVLSHAMDSVYPSHHADMLRRIEDAGGVLVTEFNTNYKPTQSVFLQRNRIIAGMGAGTLIIESPIDGGSLTIAELALGYYRMVMAVPGRIGDKTSEGTNRLINLQKATLVASVDDILRELGWDNKCRDDGGVRESAKVVADNLTGKERWLLEGFFDEGPLSADELSVRCGMPVAALSPLLLGLEMAGALKSIPGNRYIKW